MLLVLSSIMFIASFLSGLFPLSFSLSPRQLRFITLLGTGVLVGTSLIVIIPEGIETMYAAGGKGHTHKTQEMQSKIPSTIGAQQKGVSHPAEYPPVGRSSLDSALVNRRLTEEAPVDHIIIKRTISIPGFKKTRKSDEKAKEKQKQEEDTHPVQKGGDDDSTEGHKEGHTRVHAPEGEEEDHHHQVHEDGSEPHAYIGVALVLGFILMFLVDHLPEALAPTKPRYEPLHISLSDLSRGPHNSSSVSLNALNGPSTPLPPQERRAQPKSSATTIGLVIHACADGIALGASSTAPSTSLSLIIFFAIMLHKAPASFGLTSVLLKQGYSKRTARTHLLFFSLAAPLGAVVTWAIVHALGRARLGGDDGLTWTTGWVLLFSGGTFLYVAMHAMTEATSGHNHDEPMANGYVDSYSSQSGLSTSDIATVLFGMVVPLVTQVGHVH